MKLSIITINRNNAEGLRLTLESVAAQTYHEIEHVIVDGASTDNSVDVIKEYVRRVNSVYWLSEPDRGIYNAMNKGVKMCRGEYTLMLNSGDYLVDEHVIERIMPELDGTDIIQGNILLESDGCILRNKSYGTSNIDMMDVIHGYFLHQASLCRRDLFERYGYFDETYRFAGDSKFFINCLGVHDASFKYIDIDVANFDMHGFTGTQNKNGNKSIEERNRLNCELLSQRMYDYCLESEPKVELYETFKAHKWVWKIVMMLKTLTIYMYGKKTKPIVESVNHDI